MSLSLNKCYKKTFDGYDFTNYAENGRIPIPRVPELRALQGRSIVRVTSDRETPAWFTNLVNYSGVTLDGNMVIKANGQRMAATRWLSVLGVKEDKISEVGRAMTTRSFDLTLSVRFKDLIRASVSRNFRSCWNTSDIAELLTKPDIAILGHKDKHGDYDSRWICAWFPEEKGLLLFPYPYPQKDHTTDAIALDPEVSVFASLKVGQHCEGNFKEIKNISRFYLRQLHCEMSGKSDGYYRKLSLGEKNEPVTT